MSNKLKFAILAAALVAGVAMGPAVRAQSTQDTAPQGGTMGPGMMPGGDMMGMMNMMVQMGQMMETCNKMMQTAMRSPDQPQPAPGEGAPTPQE